MVGIKNLVEGRAFNRFIIGLIVVSCVLVGIETYPSVTSHPAVGPLLEGMQLLILFLFAAEVILRILAKGRRPWEFFQDPWSVIDLAVVVLLLIPTAGNYAAVLRLARVVRAFRLISSLPRLQTLVGALINSIPSLTWIGLLLGLHFYVYAVVGTYIFKDNDPLHFVNLHISLRTLFQVVTLEGWNDIFDIALYGSDLTYSDTLKALAGPGRVSSTFPVLGPMFFISFIVLGTMIILNLFTGVIIASMEEANEEVQTARLKSVPPQSLTFALGEVQGELEGLLDRIKLLQDRVQELEDPDQAPPPPLV